MHMARSENANQILVVDFSKSEAKKYKPPARISRDDAIAEFFV
jgi:hypothetical protein